MDTTNVEGASGTDSTTQNQAATVNPEGRALTPDLTQPNPSAVVNPTEAAGGAALNGGVQAPTELGSLQTIVTPSPEAAAGNPSISPDLTPKPVDTGVNLGLGTAPTTESSAAATPVAQVNGLGPVGNPALRTESSTTAAPSGGLMKTLFGWTGLVK